MPYGGLVRGLWRREVDADGLGYVMRDNLHPAKTTGFMGGLLP